MPRINLGVTKVVIQDQKRTNEIPHARLHYRASIDEIDSQYEGDVHMKPEDFGFPERKRLLESKIQLKESRGMITKPATTIR